MASKGYSKEKQRLWARYYTSRERFNLLDARLKAGLEPSSGFRAEEVVKLADFTAWLRGIQYRAFAHPNTANTGDDYNDLLNVMGLEITHSDGSTAAFLDGVNDLIDEAHAAHAEWQGVKPVAQKDSQD